MPVDRNRGSAAACRGPKTAAARAAAAPGGRASLVEPMLLCALANRSGHRYGRELLEDGNRFLAREKRVCALATTSLRTVLDAWVDDPGRFPTAAIGAGEVAPAEHDAD